MNNSNIEKFLEKNYFCDIDKFKYKLEKFVSSHCGNKEGQLETFEEIIIVLNRKKHRIMDKKNETTNENEIKRYRTDIKIIKRKVNLVRDMKKKCQKRKYKVIREKIEIIKMNRITHIKNKINKDNSIFVLPFSYEQIKDLDKKFNINTLEIINELNSDQNNRTLKLRETIELYISILEKISDDNKMEIKTVSYLIEKLKLYASKNKIIIEPREVKNKEILKEENTLSLTNEQKNILSLIKNNKELDECEIKDIIIAYSYYISNNDIIEIKDPAEKYCKYITELLVEYLYEKEESFEEFMILLNVLKNKIEHSKKETEERLVLKEIFKQFKDLYDVYKSGRIDTSNNKTYVKILDFWLQDEKNYLYIKELLKRKKFICNLRVDDKHIVLYILELYIKNYKIMLKDKNGTYINPVYLEEVYYLFTKNTALRMTKEEKIEVDNQLRDLRKYISDSIIKQKRKNYAIDKIKAMSTKNFCKYYEYEEYEDFEEEQLSNMGFYVTTLIKNQVKEKESKDAFVLGNDAYSVYEKDGLIHLTVYAINYHNFIAKDSFIDRYLYDCQIKKEKINDYFRNRMIFKVGEKYPVFAYELIFYPSGKFKELNVSKDVINVTGKYVYANTYDDAKIIEELYRKSVSKNGGYYSSFDTSKLNDHFKNILEDSFVEFLQTEKLPFIYYGYSKISEDEKEYNMNNLSNVLYDLDKASSREIIEIFSKDIDNYHYSNVPMTNAVYDLNFLEPMNFLGLEMQRMLDDCYFNQRLYSSKERIHRLKLIYLDKYIKLVEELNKKLDYVDPNVIKMSKGRIKNRIRL